MESLDRLARAVADTMTLQRTLAFHGVKLLTIADNGEPPPLMAAIKGAIAEQYIVDLGQKTKRGQAGRVRAGRIPGGRSFGYDLVPGDDRGRRTINAREAAVILRILTEYAEGRSPLAIVKEMNREGIPSPRGGAWNASTLVGTSKRENGLLQNSLYRGEIVYNRQSFVKDPATGKVRPDRTHRICGSGRTFPNCASFRRSCGIEQKPGAEKSATSRSQDARGRSICCQD